MEARSKKILVVEDQAIVAMDISDGLASMGYQVIGSANRAEQAVAQAQEQRPDLVLMDIVLKGEKDGIQAAKEIGAMNIPVVFLTAHGDESTLQRAKLSNPYGYVLKPFEMQDLHTTIEIALHRYSVEHGGGAASASALSPQHEGEVNFEFLSPDGANKLKFLSEIRLFQNLDPAALQKLAAAAAVTEIAGGAYLFHAGSPPQDLAAVATGRIGLIRSSSAGKELIVDLIGPGELVGVHALTDTLDPNISARAQTDTRVMTIPIAQVRALLSQHAEIYPRILHELGARLQKSQELASSLAHAKVEARIASTLMALLPDFGKKGGLSGHQRIFLTRKELAELTGTTPETAIRTTKNMERSGILDLSRPGIIKITNEAELRALVQ